MGFVVLIQLARVPAEATVERLAGLGIEARLLDDPNLFTKGSTGGRYLVRVSVDEQNLERARAELARWEVEAAPRVAALARELRPQFLLGSLPALVLLVLVLLGVLRWDWDPLHGAGVVGLWFGGVVAVMAWHRWRDEAGRDPADGP
jgi:hypothetical protein